MIQPTPMAKADKMGSPGGRRGNKVARVVMEPRGDRGVRAARVAPVGWMAAMVAQGVGVAMGSDVEAGLD